MSLLAQVLALGGSELTEADARNVLGLAGQDVFFGLIEAIQAEDGPGVVGVLRQVLDKGLDIGFFLRELASMWRNLFLLRQAGEKALAVVDLPAEEAGSWLAWAGRIEAAHIHACWQMTLEGQRRVQTSLEPALALELLLLNMAYLPRLLPLQNLASCAAPPVAAGPASTGQSSPSGQRPAAGPRPGGYRPSPVADRPAPYGQQPPRQASAPGAAAHQSAPAQAAPVTSQAPPLAAPSRGSASAAQAPSGMSQAPAAPSFPLVQTPPRSLQPPQAETPPTDASPEGTPAAAPPAGPKNWEGFKRFASKGNEIAGMKKARGVFEPDPAPGEVVISCENAFHRGQLTQPEKFRQLNALATEYFGPGVVLRVEEGGPQSDRLSPQDLREYIDGRPEVRQAVTTFDAEIIERKPR